MVHTGNIYDNNKNVIKLLDPLLTFSLRLLRQTDGEHIKSRIIYPTSSPSAHEVGKNVFCPPKKMLNIFF